MGGGRSHSFPLKGKACQYTQINQLQDKGTAARVRWLVGPSSGPIGRRWRSQFGVVLQDDLQLLTQHDVPSDLQLAREEGLKTI